MKNLKLLLAGLMVVSFAACSSSGDGVSDVKPTINRGITIINTKSGKVKNKNLTNDKPLSVDGDYEVGMKVDDKHPGELKNSNTINVKNKTSIGMVVRDGQNKGVNDQTGTINVDGKYSFGMYSNGKDTKITNNGTINLTGNDQVGMYVDNGSTAINETNGHINLNGSNGVGMYADGHGSQIINNGTITLRGKGTNIDDSSNNGYTGSDTEYGKDDHGNIAMKATNGGRIINKGHIKFENK
jgi:hypothetical protein